MKKSFDFAQIGEIRNLRSEEKFIIGKEDLRALAEKHFREKGIQDRVFWERFNKFWKSPEFEKEWRKFRENFVKKQGVSVGGPGFYNGSQAKVTVGFFPNMEKAIMSYIENAGGDDRVKDFVGDGVERVANQVRMLLRPDFTENFSRYCETREVDQDWYYADFMQDPETKKEDTKIKHFFLTLPGNRHKSIHDFVRLHRQKIAETMSDEEFENLMSSHTDGQKPRVTKLQSRKALVSFFDSILENPRWWGMNDLINNVPGGRAWAEKLWELEDVEKIQKNIYEELSESNCWDSRFEDVFKFFDKTGQVRRDEARHERIIPEAIETMKIERQALSGFLRERSMGSVYWSAKDLRRLPRGKNLSNRFSNIKNRNVLKEKMRYFLRPTKEDPQDLWEECMGKAFECFDETTRGSKKTQKKLKEKNIPEQQDALIVIFEEVCSREKKEWSWSEFISPRYKWSTFFYNKFSNIRNKDQLALKVAEFLGHKWKSEYEDIIHTVRLNWEYTKVIKDTKVEKENIFEQIKPFGQDFYDHVCWKEKMGPAGWLNEWRNDYSMAVLRKMVNNGFSSVENALMFVFQQYSENITDTERGVIKKIAKNLEVEFIPRSKKSS